MVFASEAEFEDAVVEALKQKGWNDSGGVLEHPSEKDLIDNWAAILSQNNCDIDRLNGCPLTRSEMQQVLESIVAMKTPLSLNGFINGGSVTIKRDNPDDALHLGKDVSLKIYDRLEIAQGQSRYQIARQPHFLTRSKLVGQKRGDLMLLINGMPVIHIELKKSGVPISDACHQIERYMHEGVFTGIFSLVQVFVAMNPEESLYFANPGPEGRFNPDYFFHWADFNNEPINDWKRVTSTLLSIPMAHQLVGFYTVADKADGILKVMRSYQFYAAAAISDRVREHKWDEESQLGGFIWHTTGSGKTMTSFKSAQLVAASKDADKVIFLVDRIELGTQSLEEYSSFASEAESVQKTENTYALRSKIKSNDSANVLIVTSIQKMSRIHAEEGGLSDRDLEAMRSKRIVFIVDECHRSTFGDMLATIKKTFPGALFFGFTGTPIHEENQRKLSTTAMVFGNELHRYSIADGIRDKNVLGFDPYRVSTFRDKDLRRAVALHEANAASEQEALADPQKAVVFRKFMNPSIVPMASLVNRDGSTTKGIESYVPEAQFENPEHRDAVVDDIADGWLALSSDGLFHALLATSSIAEAIEYYRLFKTKAPQLNVTALFDPNFDNKGTGIIKEDGLVEILDDYNKQFGKTFDITSHAMFKKDVAARLAHKEPYIGLEHSPQDRIDILIVVDQMLTGFDSKWLNTLYLDKLLRYENIIQAFSRTNRLFDKHRKPFGTIRYYRRVNTMERNIEAAVKLYSGDKPLALFAQKLPQNISEMNRSFAEVAALFEQCGQSDFAELPDDPTSRKKFASLFRDLNRYLEAAKVQGFTWDKLDYRVEAEKECSVNASTEVNEVELVHLDFDEETYLRLAVRYKDLVKPVDPPDPPQGEEVPFDIDTHLVEIDTGRIDTDYMNANFSKWLKALEQADVTEEELDQLLGDLHRSFASLSKEEQKYAELFIHDVENGDVTIEPGTTFRDYVTTYMALAKNDQVHRFAAALGMDEVQLRVLMAADVSEANINEFGRFDALKDSVDKTVAKPFVEAALGHTVSSFALSKEVDKLLRKFILEGGFEV